MGCRERFAVTRVTLRRCQVPDVDAFIHFTDLPRIKKEPGGGSAPIFAPCTSDEYADIA
jgi:Glycosyl transferase family 90